MLEYTYNSYKLNQQTVINYILEWNIIKNTE